MSKNVLEELQAQRRAWLRTLDEAQDAVDKSFTGRATARAIAERDKVSDQVNKLDEQIAELEKLAA